MVDVRERASRARSVSSARRVSSRAWASMACAVLLPIACGGRSLPGEGLSDPEGGESGGTAALGGYGADPEGGRGGSTGGSAGEGGVGGSPAAGSSFAGLRRQRDGGSGGFCRSGGTIRRQRRIARTATAASWPRSDGRALISRNVGTPARAISECGGGTICQCDVPAGRCVTATCATDAECGGGLHCALEDAPHDCTPTIPLVWTCQSYEDECAQASDCPEGEGCMTRNGRRQCLPAALCSD